MFNVHIFSKYNCKISINGSYIETLQADLSCANLFVKASSFILSSEPIINEQLLLPINAKINFNNNKLSTPSEFIKVVPFTNNHFNIILLPVPVRIALSETTMFSEDLQNHSIIVTSNEKECFVNVYLKNKLLIKQSVSILKEIATKKIDSWIAIYGKTINENYLLMLIDEHNNIKICDYCFNIETSEKELKAIIKLSDIAKHAKVITLQNNKLEEYYVYLNKMAKIEENEKLIPYALLEAIKINNTNLAKTYLSEGLQNKAASLKSFFGEITEIYYNPYYNANNTINYTVKASCYKSFNFIVANKKITDIEECSF